MFQFIRRMQITTRIVLLAALVIPFILIFVPFTTPILMAIFFAFALDPILKKIGSRTKTKKYFAFGIILFLVLFIVVPFVAFSVRVVNAVKSLSAESMQNSQFIKASFDLWEKVQTYSSQLSQTFGMDGGFIPNKEELFTKVSTVILDGAKIFLGALPDFSLSLFVFFSLLVLFNTRAGLIKKVFIESEILPADEINYIIKVLKSNCYLITVSLFLIGALQALIVALGSQLLGFQEFFLIFAVTFFLSFIPVIGAAPVAILLSLISFANQEVGHGVGMLVVALIAGSIDNILKPYVFSSESENLHPLISLFGIIGAILVFGISGLILGPFIMQVTLQLAPYLVKKLEAPLTADNIES